MKMFTFIFALMLPVLSQAQIGPVRWRVDATISGANPTISIANVTSYTGITNSALSLTNNTGSGTKVLTAQIPCSSTNAPSGTTCAVGDESIGVHFTPPGNWKGDFRACVSFNHFLQLGWNAGGQYIGTTFQVVRTDSNSQTVTAEGKSKIQSAGRQTCTASGCVDFIHAHPYTLCGVFTQATASSITLRLMFENNVSDISGTTINRIQADQNVNTGQPDIRWEVYPLNN